MARSVLRSAAFVGVIGALASGCAIPSGGGPADATAPAVASDDIAASTTAVPLTSPQGFERRAARLTLADGEVCDLCVWVASTQRQRERGLMGVTGLGDADAMAFVYEDPQRRSFWMKNTLVDLTILFVSADGTIAEVQQMEPCRRDPCPTYQPASPFAIAVEFDTADADRFGLHDAATFTLVDSKCPELAR